MSDAVEPVPAIADARPSAPARRRPGAVEAALTIAWRDLRSAFETPLAYVVLAVFSLLAGVFFLYLLGGFSQASDAARTAAASDPSVLARFNLDTQVVGPLWSFLALLLLVVAPLLTMRLFSEEERQGTTELLLTAPVPAGSLVMGKFIAGLAVCAAPLLLTAWFPLVLLIVGRPDAGGLVAGYLALVLLASAFTAVGLLSSASTSSPLLAAFLGFVALVGFAVVGMVGQSIPPEAGGAMLAWLSPLMHFQVLASGVLDTGDLAFFVLFTAAFLHLTLRVVESRRWR